MKAYESAAYSAAWLILLMAAQGWAEKPEVQQTLNGEIGTLTSFAFSPDGKLLASAGNEYEIIEIWDLATGKQQLTIKGDRDWTNWFSSVAFSPDGKLLASTNMNGKLKLWEVGSGKLSATLDCDGEMTHCAAFSHDGKIVATGGTDSTVKLWDITTRKLKATLKGHTGSVFSLAFSPDGKLLASGSKDETARLWDVVSAKEKVVLKGQLTKNAVALYIRSPYPVSTVTFSRDGKLLATGSYDSSVKLYDVATGGVKGTLESRSKGILSVAFDPTGKRVASGSRDGVVRLWDVATRREVSSCDAERRPITTVAFSPDGKVLASGCMNGRIKLWSLSATKKAGNESE